MIPPEEIGSSPARSPLVIKPELPGSFVWLSRHSGLFSPSAPVELGANYQFTLRTGLRDARDRPVKARLQTRLAAPSFAVEAFHCHTDPKNAPMRPVAVLQFNDAVQAGAAAKYLHYRSEHGLKIPAIVHPATREKLAEEGLYYYDDQKAPWSARFKFPPMARAVPAGGTDPARAPTPAAARPPVTALVVQPAQPLYSGAHWRLVADKGMPNAEGRLRTTNRFEAPLGFVQPFTLAQFSANNVLNRGKEIQLVFNKALSTNVNAGNLAQWIKVEPPVPDLAPEINGQCITLRGGFELKPQLYQVTVQPGLPAAEPALLRERISRAVAFDPLPPRVYLPSLDNDQLAAGKRRFELLGVNLAQVRVRAKVFGEETLIHALRGYRSYFRPLTWEERAQRVNPYSELDYNLIPGRTAHDGLLNLAGKPDEIVRKGFEWNQILKNQQYGVVFLQADGMNQERAEGPVSGAQALVQLTDLGMVWKRAANEAWVMIFSYASGQPVAGAAVKLLTGENGQVAAGKTDAQGLVRLSPLEGAEWLLASNDGDLHALPLDPEYEGEINAYQFGAPYFWERRPDRHPQALLFSDRPVYRPGETLHLKAIVRQWQNQGWLIPKDSRPTLALSDARGRTFLRTNLAVSALGSLDFSVTLPAAPLGQYHARLQWAKADEDESVASHSFLVKEFQPNAFEVLIEAKPAYGLGETVEIPVKARYYLGKPLQKAVARWHLRLNSAFPQPEGFGDFIFPGAYYEDDAQLANLPPLSGELPLAGASPATIRPELPVLTNAPARLNVQMEVEVTDLNQQTITATASFARDSSRFYLGLKEFPEMVVAGAENPLPVIAVDPQGRPYPSPVTVQAKLSKVVYRPNAKQGAGRAYFYDWHEELEPVLALESRTLPVRQTGVKWEIAPESLPEAATFKVPEPGRYLLEVTARDEDGNPVRTVSRFDAAGPGKASWRYRNAARLELVPDQRLYQEDGKARVLVKAPYGGRALVTIEREKVLRSFVANLEGNAPLVEIPLASGDAPNVFVSVMMLRGHDISPKQVKMPELRIGYCTLNVERPLSRLQVGVSASSAAYEPAQEVRIEALVRDNAGQPVADTEVTLYAVDEGILSLTGYQVPDPWTFFNRTLPLEVSTFFSLPHLLPEDPQETRFHNKGYLVGGGGEEAGERVRKNFLPCAFWQANLRTDAQGRVQGVFAAPDSLTRYRVIAVAHNARQQFGSGTGSFTINKPVMIEPALPLFACLGDRLVARAVAHNLTDQEGDVEVILQTDTLAAAQHPPARRTLRLPARGSLPVEFPVDLVGVGESRWTWQARFQGGARPYTDAVQSTMQVSHNQPLLREILSGRVRSAQTNLLATANPRLLEGEGAIIVRLSNSRLTDLGEPAEHLLRYPYGCVEQTSSSLMPWLVLQGLPGGEALLQRCRLSRDRALTIGLNRLLAMQTTSGGLSYWPGGGAAEPWASAYGGLMLALLDKTGAKIPEPAKQELTRYLSAQLRDLNNFKDAESVSSAGLTLFTLALLGKPEPAYHEKMFSQRAALSPENRALTALAIVEANGAKAMAVELLQTTATNAATDPVRFGCDARQIAIQLMAWCRTQPDSPRVDELVEALLAGQSDGHWLTTQGNAWGIWALAEYARHAEKYGPTSGTLAFDGQTLDYQLGAQPEVVEKVFPTRPESSKPSLILASPAGQSLFARVILETRDRRPWLPAQDSGFALERTYQLLDDQNQPRDWKQARVGDRVLVTLHLKVHRPSSYVAIDDPLPGILEPIHAEFVGGQSTAHLTGDWFHDFREVKKDRVQVFRNYLWPGNYTIRHLARVRAAGEATAPSAKAEEMYRPSRFGLSGSAKLASESWP